MDVSETKAYYEKNYTFPGDKQIGDVISKVYDRIRDADIWIPYGEVVKHYKKKRADINKRVRRSLNQHEEKKTETVCFMNLCMVQDGKGNVLALDKVNDSYTGTTFPGGHVENGEILTNAILSQMRFQVEQKHPLTIRVLTGEYLLSFLRIII